MAGNYAPPKKFLPDQYVRNFVSMPNPNAPSTGARLTVPMPLYGTVYGIMLRGLTSVPAEVTQTTLGSELSRIKVTIDGTSIVDCTVANMVKLNAYYFGAGATANNVLYIPFAREMFTNYGESSVFALGMANVKSAQVEILCGTISTIASLEMSAIVTAEVRSWGQHYRILEYGYGFASASRQSLSTLPIYNGSPKVGVAAIHAITTATNVKDINLIVNQANFYNQTPKTVVESAAIKAWRAPQTTMFSLDFATQNTHLGFLSFAGINDFRVEYNWGTAPNDYVVLMETVHNLG